MRVRKGDILVRAIEKDEKDILARWAGELRKTKIWDDDVEQDLANAEFRVGVFALDSSNPIGVASVTPEGDPEGLLDGEDWLDHLFVDPAHRGKRVRETLYEAQMAFLKNRKKRILRVPVSKSMVKFSEQRGWKRIRMLPLEMPNQFGVYELPRSCL